MACNLSCSHCGSRAGAKRPAELSTAECLKLVDDLARAGTREINLIGGEAYLRRDWLDVIAAISANGIFCTMQTGAYGLSRERLIAAKRAGLSGIGVSIDGLEGLHDEMRGKAGAFRSALDTLKICRDLGIEATVNTQIGSRTQEELAPLLEIIAQLGIKSWQLQLTVAMGNAADNDEMLLQPFQLLELMPLMVQLYYRAQDLGVDVVPGNNIGYFGPFESIWRGPDAGGHYSGCSAGMNAVGIEADGTIKACPSLNKSRYGEGSVRERSFQEIWSVGGKLSFNRDGSTDNLSGYCGECYYGPVCRGGCTWTADSLLGSPGNNPYCHYRALKHLDAGRRESIRKVEEAPNEPFGVGRFEVSLELAPPGWAARVREAHDNAREFRARR